MSNFNRNIVINLQANDNGLSAKMNQVAASTQKAANSFNQAQAPITGTGQALAKTQAETEKANGALSKLGNAFSGNRGLVFGFAGLTSAMAEAFGMMGMLGDTTERLHEAQANLNNMVESGITSGKSYADAQKEVNKQQRFFNMVNRNTMLSMMDNVFFTTMAINGLIKMGQEGGVLQGKFGKLAGAFKGLVTSVNPLQASVSGFMNAMMPLPAVAESSAIKMNAAGASMGNAGNMAAISAGKVIALSAAMAGIALGAFAIITIIQNLEELKNALTKVFGEAVMQVSTFQAGILSLRATLGIATEEEKKALGEVTEAQKIEQQALEATGVSAIAYALNINGARDKVIAKIKELVQAEQEEGKHFQDTKPLTFLQSFNAALQDQTKLWQTTDKYFNDFIAMSKEPQVKIIDMKMQIEQTVNSMEKLSNEQKAVLKQRLNDYFDGVAKAAKDAVTEIEDFQNISELTDFTVSKFWANFNANAGASGQVLKQVQGVIDQFFTDYATQIKKGMDPTEQFRALMEQTYGKDSFMYKIAMQQFNIALKEKTAATKADTKVQKDAQKVEDERIKKLKESQAALAGHITAISNFTAVNERMKKVMDETTGKVQEQAFMLRDTGTFWANLTTQEKASTDNAFQFIAAWAKTNDIINETNKSLFMQEQAFVDGLVEAKEFTQAVKLTALQEEAYRSNLVNLNKEQLNGVDTTGMLRSELEQLIQDMDGSTESAIRLARAQSDAAAESLNFFDSLLTAGSKKDFKKAWKDFDWGSIPKKFKDDVKGMFKELQPFREKANEVATALNVLNVALTNNQKNVGRGALRGIFKEMNKDLGDLAKNDALAGKLKKNLFDPFETMGKSEFNAELHKIPGTINEVAKALDDGKITLEEYNTAMAMNALETGDVSKLSDTQRQIYEDLGGKIPVDQTEKYTEAMGKLSTEAVVVETIGKMWVLLAQTMEEANALVAEDWKTNVNLMIRLAADTVKDISAEWIGLVKLMNKSNVQIANKWQTAMENILHNSQAASSQTQSEFSSLVKKLWSNFVKIANNWQKAMQNIVHNAKAAASQVNAELNKIKDKTVTITYKKVGSTQSQGGIYPMAEGGVTSAAGGLTTSNGPTYLYGDNSGGREVLAFLPKDGHKADKIMDRLDTIFGRDKNVNIINTGDGDRTIILNAVIQIGDISIPIQRKFRLRDGQDIANLV